jgi:CcmD family protein
MTTLGSIWTQMLVVALQTAPATPAEPAPAGAWPALWKLGGMGWIYVVNLIIWTGLFLYLLRLDSRLRNLEKEQ